MLNTKGLSLASSPPFTLPLRFFLTAPLFGMVAGLLIVFTGEPALLSRWMPATLAVVHLLVLGFVSMIMCGALLQILPVLLGADSTNTPLQGAAVHTGLAVGTLLLAIGFQFDLTAALLLGALLAAGALALFIALAGRALLTATGPGRARITVTMAVFSLAVTVTLGLMLAGSRGGWFDLPIHEPWVDTHLAWGMIGWVFLLLIGIAGELLSMFYRSPSYPPWLKRSLPAAMLALLLMLLPYPIVPGAYPVFSIIQFMLMIGLATFAVISFILQWRRRRPRRDATLGFWWLTQAAVVLAVVAWLNGMPDNLVGVLAIVGGGMSFTSGTLYKIVPFLSWYHLQTRKVMQRRSDIKLPTMQRFISEGAARWQLATHAAALLLLSLAAWQVVPTARLGGMMLAISALLLWANLLRAFRLYRAINRVL